MPESERASRQGEQRQRVPGRASLAVAGHRAFARGALAIQVALLVALLAATARAQSGPTSPPPAATAPAMVPIEPLTTRPGYAPPTLAVPGPFAGPAAAADAPPVAVAPAPSHDPFYQKWWFWTAVGAAAVTTFAIIIATSGTSPPHTDFGNMPAF